MKPDKVTFLKKLFNMFIILLAIIFVACMGYKIYNAAVEDITKRVRREASKGVIDTINPIKWPGKIFGGIFGKKKRDED